MKVQLRLINLENNNEFINVDDSFEIVGCEDDFKNHKTISTLEFEILFGDFNSLKNPIGILDYYRNKNEK